MRQQNTDIITKDTKTEKTRRASLVRGQPNRPQKIFEPYHKKYV